jgi:hypothetical protein
MTAKADSLFTPSEICVATGASPRLQAQRWAHHIYQPSTGDTIPRGYGDARGATPETVYRIAITEECAKAGVHIRKSKNAALIFAEDQRGRRANTLYEFGRTLLKISENGAEIINAPFDALLSDVCAKDGAFVVDIGSIVKAVTEKLSQIKRK